MKKTLGRILALTVSLASIGMAVNASIAVPSEESNIYYSYSRNTFTAATAGAVPESFVEVLGNNVNLSKNWLYKKSTTTDGGGNLLATYVTEKQFDGNSALQISNAIVGVSNYISSNGTVKTDYPYFSTKFMIDGAGGNAYTDYYIGGWSKTSTLTGTDGYLVIRNGSISVRKSNGEINGRTTEKIAGLTISNDRWYTLNRQLDFSKLGEVYSNFSISDDTGATIYTSGWYLDALFDPNTAQGLGVNGYDFLFDFKSQYSSTTNITNPATIYIDDFTAGWYLSKPLGFFNSGSADTVNKYLRLNTGNGDLRYSQLAISLHNPIKTAASGANLEIDDYNNYDFEMDIRMPQRIYWNSENYPFAVSKDIPYGDNGGYKGSPLKIVNGKGYFQSVLNASGGYGPATGGTNTTQITAYDSEAFDMNPGQWYNIKMSYRNTTPAVYTQYQAGETYVSAIAYDISGNGRYQNVYLPVTVTSGAAADTKYYKLTSSGSGEYNVTVTNKATGEIFTKTSIPFDNINIRGGSSVYISDRNVGKLSLVGGMQRALYEIDNLKVSKVKMVGAEEERVNLIDTDFEDKALGSTMYDIYTAEKTQAYGNYTVALYTTAEENIWNNKTEANAKTTVVNSGTGLTANVSSAVVADNVYNDSISGKTNVATVPANQTYTLKGAQTLKAGCINKTTVKLLNAANEECTANYSVTQAADNKSFIISFANANPLDPNTEYTLVLDGDAIVEGTTGLSLVDNNESFIFTTAASDDSAATLIVSDAVFTNTGGGIGASVKLTSTASVTPLKYLVVLGLYDSTESKLLGVSLGQGLIQPGAAPTITIDPVNVTEAGAKAKLMIWDSWDSMSYYTSSIPYNN